MSDREKPSQLRVVTDSTGEVIEAAPANRFTEKLYAGREVFELPPVKWIIPKWLPAESVAAIYSEPGIGKSTYALALALELATGGSWCGHKLDRVPVLYVAAERATITRDRLEAWSKHHEQEIPEHFYTLDAAPQLGDHSHTHEISELIRENRVRVVVFDTYARATLGLDENSSKDTGPIMEALSKLVRATEGGSVVVVHHSGKDSARGMRGSTAFLGAVDLTVRLSRRGDDLVEASVEKSNAARAPLPEHYRFHSVQLDPLGDDEFRQSPVLIPEPFRVVRNETDSLTLEIITESPGLQQSEILTELKARLGVHKKTGQNSLDRLCASGQILRTEQGRGVFYSLPAEAE